MGLSNRKIFQNFKEVFKEYKLNPLRGVKIKRSNKPRKWSLLKWKKKHKAVEEPIQLH